MSSPDTNQIAIAAACIVDATLSAIDPSGASLRRARRHLSDGLLLAEQMGVDENVGAAAIIKQVLVNLEGMETLN